MRRALLTCLLLACTPVEQAGVELEPGPAVTRRLTRAQYQHAVEALFGPDLQMSVGLEPDVRASGLTALGAGITATSPRGVEEYEVAAYELAEQAVAADRRDRWVPCAPTSTVDEECAEQALSWLAYRAWRRPVRDEELATLVGVAGSAAQALDDFWGGLEFGAAAVLQSPHFLFRVEVGEADPAGGRRLTAYELASRLSFLLWNAPPDDPLLQAAASGELDDASGIDSQAQRLLADPRAHEGLRAWLTDMLHLDELDDLDKDPGLFPHISPTLGPAAREETLQTAAHLVFTEDTDLRSLLTTRTTFLNRELAALYGVQAPTLEGFAQVELPASQPRRGLLGQASFLALQSHSTSSSATLRGLAIREILLCDPPPPPPSGVDTSIPESDGDKPTLRDRVQSHLADPSCSGCHEKMDLLGLALENYDAIGQWRQDENGHPIDASGSLNGVDFDGPDALSTTLYDDPMLSRCMVRQVMRRGLGRTLRAGEVDTFEGLHQAFLTRDGRALPLWMDLVTNPVFRSLEDTP